MSFKHILVPVDFSECSDKAVEYALFIAETFCAKATLLHAVVLFKEDIGEEEHLKAFEKLIEKKEEERAKRLKLRCDVGGKRGIAIDSDIIRGFSPADAVLEYMDDKKTDLIVMGTHGRTGFMKWWLGSVAEKVVRRSPVPVLTVHQEWTKQAIDTMLVPIDFSDFSKKAVQQGKAVADAFGAKLKFLHAVEQEAHPAFYATSLESIFKVNPQLKSQIRDNMVDFTGIPKDRADYDVVEGKAQPIQDYRAGIDVLKVILGAYENDMGGV